MSAKFGFQVIVNDRAIWVFPEDIDAAVSVAKAQANAIKKEAKDATKQLAKAGIAYGWVRGPEEEPISLGTFTSLIQFVDNNIIGALPAAMKPEPKFELTKSFDSLVQGLPDPFNEKITDLKDKASFELDALRLKIPGKDSSETMKFEIAMLINLQTLDYELGPFKLNQLYAKLGNFDSVTA